MLRSVWGSVLVLSLNASLSFAQVSSWDSVNLTAVVDDAAGGAYVGTRAGTAGGTFVPTTFLPNGTALAVTGAADASGRVPVRWSGGQGWIPGAQVAAVGDSYMPSATDPGLYLPASGGADRSVTLTLDPSSGAVTSVGELGQAAPAGDARAPDGNTSLLGIPGGGTNPGVAPGGPLAPIGSAGQGAPAPQGSTGASVSGWNRRIIATAEEATRGAGGALGANAVYVALPHPKALRQTLQIQLTDAQGNGYGSALTAPVKDVGPWRVNDAYWESGGRPYAEGVKGQRVAWTRGQGYMASAKGRRCNGAGIDVSTALWTKLKPGLSRRQAQNQTGNVNWTFGAQTRVD